MLNKKGCFNSAYIIIVLIIASSFTLKVAKCTKSSKFKLADRYEAARGLLIDGTSELDKQNNVVKLSLGMPDFFPPTFMRNALWNVTMSDDWSVHQYSQPFGHPKLRKSIVKLYSGLINRDLDPEKNVVVTIGATQALFLTFQAHTSPGDEWIIIEPAFEFYVSMIRGAGGVPKVVHLKPTKTRGKITSRDWVYDKKEMARLFNKKTKGIVVNTPHNPTGKVFTRDELQFIANLAIKWNTLVITDEVYEWLVYNSNKHIRMATLPDMFERTITISSASKTFSATGWRVGWAYGPEDLINNLKAIQWSMTYSGVTSIQLAVAQSLKDVIRNVDRLNSYLVNFVRELQSKRNDLLETLEEIGMAPVIPEGGYYIMANWTSLTEKVGLDEEEDNYDDERFVKWLAKNVGVLVTPVSIYYSDMPKDMGEMYVRLCFVKKNKTLQKASKILLEWIQW